eukprot:5406018-Pleurochrysis_carterae.AAC.3
MQQADRLARRCKSGRDHARAGRVMRAACVAPNVVGPPPLIVFGPPPLIVFGPPPLIVFVGLRLLAQERLERRKALVVLKLRDADAPAAKSNEAKEVCVRVGRRSAAEMRSDPRTEMDRAELTRKWREGTMQNHALLPVVTRIL